MLYIQCLTFNATLTFDIREMSNDECRPWDIRSLSPAKEHGINIRIALDTRKLGGGKRSDAIIQ